MSAAGRGAAPVLVGGAIRDGLLGRPSLDLDVAVPRAATETARRTADRVGGAFVPLDGERDVARVIAAGFRLDIAAFRAATLEGDLRARDYTINALAVSLPELLRDGGAPIIDPSGGLADLRARRLRIPAPAALTDDPLRALRGVRLESLLGFRLDRAAQRSIRAAAASVSNVSAERVRDEVIAMLALSRTGRTFRRLDALSLLSVILPEVDAMRATAQPAPHRFDVLEHSLRAVEGVDRLGDSMAALAPFGDDLADHLSREVAVDVQRWHTWKLAALLHDVAKPETRREVDGRIRFFEHDLLGADRVRAIGDRLRLPARVTALVERLVRHHLRPMHLEQAGEVTRRARYRFFRDLGEDARDLLLLALVDAAAVTGESPLRTWRRASLIRDLLGGFAEAETIRAAPPLLTGDDVMRHFSIGPGPEVGRLLDRAREAQALGLIGSRDEALAFLDSPRTDPYSTRTRA